MPLVEHEGEVTRRHRILLDQRQKQAESWKLWTGIACGLVAAGFAAAMYLRQFATDADVKALSVELAKHRLEEGQRLSAVEALTRNIEEDYHWQRAQLSVVAEKLGAERVAPPAHDVKGPK